MTLLWGREGGVVRVIGRIVGAAGTVCFCGLLWIGELLGLLGALFDAGELTGLLGALFDAGEL